jgi:hypothetical protein
MVDKPTKDPKPAVEPDKKTDKPNKAKVDKEDLDKVTGGVNPQPLPPRHRPI